MQGGKHLQRWLMVLSSSGPQVFRWLTSGRHLLWDQGGGNIQFGVLELNIYQELVSLSPVMGSTMVVTRPESTPSNQPLEVLLFRRGLCLSVGNITCCQLTSHVSYILQYFFSKAPKESIYLSSNSVCSYYDLELLTQPHKCWDHKPLLSYLAFRALSHVSMF